MASQDVRRNPATEPGLSVRLRRWIVIGAMLAVAGALPVWRYWPSESQSPVQTSVTDSSSESTSEGMALPVEEAKYLQDVEHLGGFVLGDLTFPKVAQALKDRDPEALKAFLGPQFQGGLFDDVGGATVQYPFATFHTWQEADDTLLPCDRDTFVAKLLGYRNEFEQLEAAAVKIMQMSPDTDGQLEGPWHGTFKLVLAGRTGDGAMAHREIKFRCGVSGISDETPDQQEWLLNCEAYSAQTSRSADALMRDMTDETGIDVSALRDNWKYGTEERRPFLTGGVYACDYNRDGLFDLLLTDKNGSSFYEGRRGGTFVNVTGTVGLPRTRALGAVFADFDGDGYEDLILGTQIYRNDRGKRFVELRPDEHTLHLHPKSQDYSVVDYDRDGRVDLYVVGLPLEQSEKPRWIGKNKVRANELWHNLGDWHFENVTEESGTKGNGSPTFAAVWFDANGDDWPDVMTACELGTNDYLLNQHDGTFRTGVLPKGYGGFSMGITLSDVDNDGFGDPYVANMYSKAGQRIVGNLRPGIYDADVDAKMRDFVGGNELYHNRGDGTFERIGHRAGINDVGWTYGVGYVDLNGDGLPDLYSPAGFQSVSPHKPDG